MEGGEISRSDVGLNGRPLSTHITDKIKEKAAELKAADASGGETNTAAVQTPRNVVPFDECGSAEESD